MPADYAAIERMLSWEGMLGRFAIKRIEKFEDVVRVNAPYRVDNPGRHLVQTIGHHTDTAPNMLLAYVGTDPERHMRGYAIIVHRGSRPHAIKPRPPRLSLRFQVAGRIVYARRVWHPGTAPDPFLTRWIRELTK